MDTLIQMQQIDVPSALSADAVGAKTAALATAAGIVKVSTAEDWDKAQSSLVALKSLIKGVTDAHREAKAPVLAASRALDGLKNEYCAELTAEAARLERLAGDYQRQEAIRAEAARRAVMEEQQRIAAQGAALVEQATDDAEKAAIVDATASAMLAAKSVGMSSAGALDARGTKLIKSLEVEVVDIKALYLARPECVKLSPNMTVIKSLIKSGIHLPGVIATEVNKTSVKTQPVVFAPNATPAPAAALKQPKYDY